MILSDQAKNFPLTPGVYIFKSRSGEPLYIGRATSLRRRVLQYFRKDIDARIGEMVSLAGKIIYHPTDTVLEAIILEANLIKKYWPKYNIKDKDNRSFVYIVFPKTDFPKPIIVRGRELESFPLASPPSLRGAAGGLPSSASKSVVIVSNRRQTPLRSPLERGKGVVVFGPYQSLTVVKNALKIIRRIFPYSTCGVTGKPCFDYQIGLCPGVCVGAVSKEEYRKNINNIILLLRGEKNKLLKKLAKENPLAASALKHIQDVTLITREEFQTDPQKFNRIEGYDISHFSGKETYGSMVVFKDGKPDKSQYRLFKIKTVTNNDLEALKEMLERRLKHAEWPKADLILIDGGKPQIDYIGKFLEPYQIKTPFLGIAKLSGDRLVFPAKSKSTFKDLAESIKTTLQQVRDEAHRFANGAHRRSRSRRLKY